jgi:N-acetylglucosamine-6-phosphate deacetylase
MIQIKIASEGPYIREICRRESDGSLAGSSLRLTPIFPNARRLTYIKSDDAGEA